MTKERVYVRKETIDLDDIFSNTDPDGMMAGAKKLYDRCNKAAFEREHFVEFTTEWAGYDGGTEVVATFYRWETDVEYQARLDVLAAKEEAKRQRQEAKKAKMLAKALESEAEERALLAKLQEKYGS